MSTGGFANSRTIARSSLLPVILSGAKNPILGAGTLRFAQGDNLPNFAIVLGKLRVVKVIV